MLFLLNAQSLEFFAFSSHLWLIWIFKIFERLHVRERWLRALVCSQDSESMPPPSPLPPPSRDKDTHRTDAYWKKERQKRDDKAVDGNARNSYTSICIKLFDNNHNFECARGSRARLEVEKYISIGRHSGHRHDSFTAMMLDLGNSIGVNLSESVYIEIRVLKRKTEKTVSAQFLSVCFFFFFGALIYKFGLGSWDLFANRRRMLRSDIAIAYAPHMD